MTWSKCEQCNHPFDFPDDAETNPCPQCGFETRLFPLPRPLPKSSSAPRWQPVPDGIPLNRSSGAPSPAREDHPNTRSIPYLLIIAAIMIIIVLAGDSLRETLFVCGGLIGGGLIYFLPSIVAQRNNHRQFQAICILNLVAGWTFVGWVIALVWAVMKPK